MASATARGLGLDPGEDPVTVYEARERLESLNGRIKRRRANSDAADRRPAAGPSAPNQPVRRQGKRLARCSACHHVVCPSGDCERCSDCWAEGRDVGAGAVAVAGHASQD